MRKAKWIVGSLFIVGLLLAAAAFVALLVVRRSLFVGEATLARPEVYKPAGLALAKLCQSDPDAYSDQGGFFPAWAPPDVLKLQPSVVFATAQSAKAGFGGGFHHYGYELALDAAASTATENRWTLTLFSEDSDSKTLETFTTLKSDHFELSEIVDNAMAEYDRRAARGIDEASVRERIAFLLKHHQQSRAIESIGEFAAKYPHDWLDILLAYLLAAPNDPQAAVRLNAWAGKDNDFTSWLYAAYAYSAAGDMNAAEAAVKQALHHPANDPPWVRNNARYRGSTMCQRLYAAGKFKTCVALCDALLAYSDSGQGLAGEIQTIRDLAARGLADPKQAPATPQPIPYAFDPLEGIDVQALTAAPPATRPGN